MLRNKEQPKRRWLDLAPGDPVVVTAGKDKGKTGEVLRTIPDKHKIVVKGVNILKRHTKAGRSRGGVSVAQGGVVDFEAPLDYSNVMLVCPVCGKPTRVGLVTREIKGQTVKIRVCKKCHEEIDKGDHR